jgi:hypothetical protein
MKFRQLALALVLLLFETQVLVSEEQKSGSAPSKAAVMGNIFSKQRSVYAVAVSTNSSKVDIAQLDCLSLDPNWAHVDRIDHSDDGDMRKAVAQHFKNSSLNSPDCGFFIKWTIVHQKTLAVRYRGDPSVALMSISICKKPLDSPVGQQCLSRNIWFFDKIGRAADEYTVGIKAFISSSNAEWSVVNVSSKNE